ncbi:MAG: hypothetical protein MJE77_11435 [Proteobacteria bacterium]|nr:hypothetical protein [Pseudomonadota bacterium]
MKTRRVLTWALALVFFLASGGVGAQSNQSGSGSESASQSEQSGSKASRSERKETRRERRRRERREARRKRRREARKAAAEAEAARAEEANAAAAEAEAAKKAEAKNAEQARNAEAGQAAARAQTGAVQVEAGHGTPEAGDGSPAEPAQSASPGSAGSKDQLAGGEQLRTQPQAGSASNGKKQRPWEKGVSTEDRQAAWDLFRQANKHLKDSLFVKAVAKYREALTHWDHPGIHFNLALALQELDQPLALHESLEKAMQHGPSALGKERFARARDYKKLVLKQLANLEVTCLEPEARVTLNGELLFVAPGKWKGLVRVGKHNIVATKTGYINANEVHELKHTDNLSLELKLYTAEDVTGYRRRWSRWKPWTVFGVGTALALTGAGFHWAAVSNYDDFDQRIEDCRTDPNRPGCRETEDILPIRDRADVQQGVAYALYAVGGATLVSGLVLVYANRLKPYRLDVEERDRRVVVVPVIGGDMAGISAAFRF